MALLALGNEGTNEVQWYPTQSIAAGLGITTSAYLMDASGEKSELALRAPMAADYDRFGAIIAAVANTPDNGLRFSFQDTSLTTGLGDGTVDQFATVAQASVVTGFLDPGAFSANRTLARNEKVTLVCDFPTFVAGDSVTVQGMLMGSNSLKYPAAGLNAAKRTADVPQFFLHTTAGLWIPASCHVYPFTSLPGLTYGNGSAPREAGLAFKVRTPRRLRVLKISASISTGANFDVVLYDDADTVLSSESYDDLEMTATGTTWGEFLMDSDVLLEPGREYFACVVPTTATTLFLGYGVVPAALFGVDGALPGRGDLYMVARTTAGTGAWTRYNNGTDGYRYPTMLLGFSHESNHARAHLHVGI